MSPQSPIPASMTPNIEQKVRELADKWRHSQMEASQICRDAAEELRVSRLKIQSLLREIEVYKKFVPQKEQPSYQHELGWGKGPDE